MILNCNENNIIQKLEIEWILTPTARFSLRLQAEQWNLSWTACPVFTGEPVTGRNYAFIVKFWDKMLRRLSVLSDFTAKFSLERLKHSIKASIKCNWLSGLVVSYKLEKRSCLREILVKCYMLKNTKNLLLKPVFCYIWA